jgi:ATP-dependent DNA ligase
MTLSEIARRVMARAGMALARDERGGRGPQPVEIIDGMPAAPEPCLLANTHWTPALHPRQAIAQPKIDGMRALCLQSRIVTRQALPLNAALHCLPALDRLERKFGQPMVFDGEYQEPEGFGATLAAHKRGEGCGTFWLFDAVPFREWKANRFTQPLHARLAAIESLVGDDEPFLCFLPGAETASPENAEAFAEAAWARGMEGLVVKDARSLYCRGRSNAWLKLKRGQTLDGPVVDVVVPDGDVARGIALVRLDGRTHKVAAMPPDVRALLKADVVHGRGQGLTGRMVEVGFNERTETGALRGARIVRLRPDKEEGEL